VTVAPYEEITSHLIIENQPRSIFGKPLQSVQAPKRNMNKMEKNDASAEYDTNTSIVEKQISRDPNGRMDIGLVNKEQPLIHNNSQEINQPKSQLYLYNNNSKTNNTNILAQSKTNDSN
jgi:hypothetical protein